MSGIEPGRPSIEEREAQYISVGTRILTPEGVEWTVRQVDDMGDDNLGLRVERTITDWQFFEREELVRCRVEKEV